MNVKLLLLLLILGPALANGQAAKSDLSKLSSAQLTSCLSNTTLCGTDDATLISAELAARLPHFSFQQLLNCYADQKICGADSDSLTAEIVRRGNPHLLIESFGKEANPSVRAGILQSVHHFNSSEVIAFMRRVLAEKKGDDDSLYWPANYLAKLCDQDALQWLSTRNGRSQGCLPFTETITAFGKCHYRPAIPYLIQYSLNDACQNIVVEAEADLHALFPHSPKEFKNVEQMQKYYCDRAKQEGIKVNCASN